MLKLLAITLALAPAIYSQCATCTSNTGYNNGYGASQSSYQSTGASSSSSSNNQPGYLPQYQGDKYTNQQRIQETQALNKQFFDSIGGEPPAPPKTPAQQGQNVWQQYAFPPSGGMGGQPSYSQGQGAAGYSSQYNPQQQGMQQGATYYNPSTGYSNQQYGNMPCCGSNYNSNSRMYNPTTSSFNNGYNTQYGYTGSNGYNTPMSYSNTYGTNSYNQNRMYDTTYGASGYGYNNQYTNGMSSCCSSVSSSCCYQTGSSGNVYYDPNMRTNTYTSTPSPYGYSSTTMYPYTNSYTTSGYGYNQYGKKK